MRVKNILSIIAFVTAFIVSAGIASVFTPRTNAEFVRSSFDRNTARDISRFLQQDVNNGYERDVDAYSSYNGDAYVVKHARAVADYSETSGAMDYSNFPQDFQLSWLKHMRAWHNYSDFLQKVKNQQVNSKDINQLENQYLNEINSTWYETLRVGGKYGASVRQ